MQDRLCEVCVEGRAKYRCPRCAIQTCSLSCVKVHKRDTECDGTRDKTAYVAMKEFTDQSLLSDYRFLEDVDRKADSITRDQRRKHRTLPKHLYNLVRMARLRKVTVKILPYVFTKRKINSSMFSTRDQEILWHIEWIFPQCEVKYSDRRISETTLLKNVLEKYVDPSKGDPVIRQRLKKYVSAGLDNITLFMKVENRSAQSVRYHLLNMNQTIADNLLNKYIVEYPTIHVVLPDHCQGFPIIGEVPTDEENTGSSSSDSDSSSSSSEESSESGDTSGGESSSGDSQMPEECSILHTDPVNGEDDGERRHGSEHHGSGSDEQSSNGRAENVDDSNAEIVMIESNETKADMQHVTQ
ncbi:box C/D snoRNA protein 1-like [Ptychodera flava]|uniref:box C/D snoRNA protein 1-like n=1 Tax=Ptychodera flava TaxID=63121 RepID=UPI003969C68D